MRSLFSRPMLGKIYKAMKANMLEPGLIENKHSELLIAKVGIYEISVSFDKKRGSICACLVKGNNFLETYQQEFNPRVSRAELVAWWDKVFEEMIEGLRVLNDVEKALEQNKAEVVEKLNALL